MVCPFSDVRKDAYYEDAVIWAAENNIVRGYTDKIFAPVLSVVFDVQDDWISQDCCSIQAVEIIKTGGENDLDILSAEYVIKEVFVEIV